MRGDRNKLGTCSFAECRTERGTLVVVNAYTQFDLGRNKRHTDYDAMRRCMQWVSDNHFEKRIGMPRIGAGLGGGEWLKIETIIEDILRGMDVTIVQFM